MTHAEQIASQLNVKPSQVTAVINLLDEGNTVPFIARYRKEMTGSLDDEQIRIIADELVRLRALDERRTAILASIEEQGKLPTNCANAINAAVTMTALEDLYAPYKKKRRTRAMVAREKGLEPLADLILKQDLQGSPEEIAKQFLNDQVTDVEEALQGARDIVAEMISDNANVRAATREKALKFSKVRVEKIADAVDEKAVYESYYEFEQRVDRLQPHQILAITRGEKEGILRVHVDVPERDWLDAIQAEFEQDIISPVCRSTRTGHSRFCRAAFAPRHRTRCPPRKRRSRRQPRHSSISPPTCAPCLASRRWRVTSSSVSTLASARAAKLRWLTPQANCSTQARSIRTNRRTTGRARSIPCRT